MKPLFFALAFTLLVILLHSL